VNMGFNIDRLILPYLSVSHQYVQVSLKKLPLLLSVFPFISLPLIGCDAKVIKFLIVTA